MALILNIETATPLCTVALTRDGAVIAIRETIEEKSHASELTVFIGEVMKEGKVEISNLDAVAVGKGPGSYTGLRIGVSTAKGICFGSQTPLIAVSTLDILIRQAKLTGWERKEKNSFPVLLCPMIDARRMEVFTCLVDEKGETVVPVQASIVEYGFFEKYLKNYHIVFFGSGMEKCKEVLDHPHAYFLEDIAPHSSALGCIAEHKFIHCEFEDIAYFEPFYLKDFIATVSKKGLKV
jgi:tRNA threonylcarbamoyladenosine biosynthesis protein TsaB